MDVQRRGLRQRAAALLATAVAAAAVAASPATAEAQGIWLTQSEIKQLAMSGTAWTSLKKVADSSWGSAKLSDGNSNHDVYTLAGALVYVRTGNESYRSKVLTALRSVPGTENGSGDGPAVLALGRNLVSYVIAADLVGFSDASWRSWLSAVRTRSVTSGHGNNLVGCHELRPNNWGTNCGASRIAAAVYLGDMADLGRAVQVFRGFLGDRSQYSGLKFGDLSWQCDPAKPVGINPKGCAKQGHSIDGVLPDDQRRGGSFTWPPPREDYVWGALGPALVQAELLYRAGYTQVYQWSDAALKRALGWLHAVNNYPSSGDNRWATWLGNFAYGTSHPASSPTRGKSMAWTDWTHARKRGTSAPGPGPSSESTPGPGSSSESTPEPEPSDPGGGSSPGAEGTAFVATADAHVYSKQPTERYGDETRLRASGTYRTYIAFSVTGLDGPAASATLRLRVTNTSPATISVHRVTGGFSEATVTWSTAPAPSGAALGSFRASTNGVWVEVDLGDLVKGNGAYTLALQGTGDDFAAFTSTEDSRAPTLVIG